MTTLEHHHHPPMLDNVEVERGDDGQTTLRITVAQDAVRQARQAALRGFAKQMRVPGFRPGHVPPNIVRRNVGEEAIAQKVSDELLPHAYQHAIADAGISPLTQAQVEELSFEAFSGESPVTFVARVIPRPDIALPELSGLQVEHPSVEVSDEDVENGIQALREERASFRDIEGRGAQEGDMISAELRVFMDGEQRGEMARLRPFVLGESGFVPRIDDELVGATLDEERRFTTTYPDDFQDAELAGQTAEFAVKVTALKERVLPELDEAFISQAGVANEDELRARMREFIRANRLREGRDEMRDLLAKNVADASNFETPRALIESRYENRLAALQEQSQERGMTLDDQLKASNMTGEEFEARGREELEGELRRELVLDEIARQQNLDVSGDELEQYYLRLAQMYNRPIEELVRELPVSDVRASILQRKAVDYLLQNAQVLNAPEELEVAQDDEATVEATEVTEAATPAPSAASEQ